MDSSISTPEAPPAPPSRASAQDAPTDDWRVVQSGALGGSEYSARAERLSRRPAIAPMPPLGERLGRLFATLLTAAALLATLWVLATRFGWLELPGTSEGAPEAARAENESVLVLEPFVIEGGSERALSPRD